MDTNFQLKLAKEAGKITLKSATYDTWEEEYKYHVGMVQNPFPFGVFKLKLESLDRMFNADPDGKNPAYDKPIQKLCNELGY
ncbi:MAG: hypothetical protein WC333_02030 [Dehalococcoidia bacterium]|jgi:hypothetical protein